MRIKVRSGWAGVTVNSPPNRAALHPQKDLQVPLPYTLPASDSLSNDASIPNGGSLIAASRYGRGDGGLGHVAGPLVNAETEEYRRWSNAEVAHWRDRSGGGSGDGSDERREPRRPSSVNKSAATARTASAAGVVAAVVAKGVAVPPRGRGRPSKVAKVTNLSRKPTWAPAYSGPDAVPSAVPHFKASSHGPSCPAFPGEERTSSTSSPSSCSSSSTFGGASSAHAAASAAERSPRPRGGLVEGCRAPLAGAQMGSAMDVNIEDVVTAQYREDSIDVEGAELPGYTLVETYPGRAGAVDSRGKGTSGHLDAGAGSKGVASAHAVVSAIVKVRANNVHREGLKTVLRPG
ncbi:unnamed protein product [Ascophyllum nodosum]